MDMDTESVSDRTPLPLPTMPAGASMSEHVAAPHEEPESELDRPKNRMIGAIVAGTLALLVGVVIGVNEIFRSVFNHEISSKQLEHQGTELRELRAQEQARLSRYQWVSRKDGVVRIPLDRARALTLAAYQARATKPEAVPADPPRGTR
jgi:hypothetical protein